MSKTVAAILIGWFILTVLYAARTILKSRNPNILTSAKLDQISADYAAKQAKKPSEDHYINKHEYKMDRLPTHEKMHHIQHKGFTKRTK